MLKTKKKKHVKRNVIKNCSDIWCSFHKWRKNKSKAEIGSWFLAEICNSIYLDFGYYYEDALFLGFICELFTNKKNISRQVTWFNMRYLLLVSPLAHSSGVCYFNCIGLSENSSCLCNLWLAKCGCVTQIPEMSLNWHINFWNKEVFSKSVVQDCGCVTCWVSETRDELAPPQIRGVWMSSMGGTWASLWLLIFLGESHSQPGLQTIGLNN